jgi:phosphonate transport system permease protein
MSDVAALDARVGRPWRKPPLIRSRSLRWTLGLGALIYLVLAIGSLEVNWLRVYEGLDRGWAFILAFTQPDFTSRASDITDGMIESVIMTVTSTVVGIAISIPIGLGAARNIAPLPVYLICRGIVSLSRALNEIIIAILLVAIFGFGPLAGFLTLSFATIGFLSKLLAEDIEDMSKAQAEAIRATGSSWLQWINYGVQPQVMPRLIGLSMYRLDINFRESAVLGLVGAGGIGATLNTAFDRYEFDTAAAIILIIIGTVMALEYLSGIIRARAQ